MFFKRHKPEEPTENENPISSELSQSKPTEGAYPGVEQLPDTLKLIDRKGREDGGWLFDTGPMEPTGDDIISVFRHATDGRIEYKHVPYKDLVEWNIGDNVDNIEEHNMTETTQPGSDDEADQSMSDEERKAEEEKRIRDGAARFTQLYQPEDFPEVTIPTSPESPLSPEPISPTVETGHEEPTPPLFAQPLPTDSPEPAEPPSMSAGVVSPETEIPTSIPMAEPILVGAETDEPPVLGAASEVLYWDDKNYDRDWTGEVIERNGIKYEVRRLADDTQPSRYYLVPEGMKDEDIPEEFLHPEEAEEVASDAGSTTAPPLSTPGGVGEARSDSGIPDEGRTEEVSRAETAPAPVKAKAELTRPDEDLLRSAREAIEGLSNSAIKKEAKERIEELESSDFKRTHKDGDLDDTSEQNQARVDLKVEKLTDTLEKLKTPLLETKEKDGRTAEDNITLQAQLLLNISEKNKYNEINRENLEKTIRLATTLIGHDQEAVRKAAVKGNIEAASDTLAQLKEYIIKAKEDAVYMSTPGAQETLAGYQRTIDRLETILQGSIHNHAIDEVVAELRGTLVHRGGSGPEGVGRRVGEVTPVIPGGEDVTGAIPPDGGGEGILPPDGGGGAGPETLTPEEIKDNLDEARDEYLEAYNIRKKWFRKRVSPELEERLRERYKQATLRYARQRAEEDVTRDNPETTGAERQALIEARMIIEAQNERKVFSDLEIKRLNEKSEKFTRTQKIRKWMKDHPKTVIFAGLAMGGIPGGILFGVGAYDLANKYFGASKPKQELFFREEIENDPDKINAKVAQLVEGASRDEKTIDNDKERKRLYDKVLRIEREEMERIRTENPNLPNDQIEARIIGQAMNYLETREDIRDIKRKRQIIAAVSATVFGPWIGGAYGVFGYLV